MKKAFSVFLTCIFIISVFSIACYADNPVKLTLESETETVYAGDEFLVKLLISDNSKMSGAIINVNYDKTKLEFVSGTFGGILDSSATKSIRNIDGDEAQVRFNYMSPSSSVTSQGALMTVKFRILEGASGNTELTISISKPGDFVAQDLSRLPYTVENINILIKNVESETVSESITETESTTKSLNNEITTKPETTTKVAQNDDGDNVNMKIVIIAILILGFAILLFVVILGRNTKQKKRKRRRR